jgi:hypothetical protein
MRDLFRDWRNYLVAITLTTGIGTRTEGRSLVNRWISLVGLLLDLLKRGMAPFFRACHAQFFGRTISRGIPGIKFPLLLECRFPLKMVWTRHSVR